MRIVTEVRGKRMLCNVKKKKMSPIRIRCSCVRDKILVFWESSIKTRGCCANSGGG